MCPFALLLAACRTRWLLGALLALACLPASLPAAALPPSQTMVYVGTEIPLAPDTKLGVMVFGWALGKSKQLGLYTGPSWYFLDEKLNFSLKAGAYVDDTTYPLLNAELLWEDGDYQIDWFNDMYYLGNGHPGLYSWLSGQYTWKSVYVGAMVDVMKDFEIFQMNVGPVVGFGNDKLNVGVAPVYSRSIPGDASDGFGVRFLINIEFAGEEATKGDSATAAAEPKPDAKPADTPGESAVDKAADAPVDKGDSAPKR